MSKMNLGIIGGGQLGSLLSVAAKKLNIQTIIYSDDPDALEQVICVFQAPPEFNSDRPDALEHVICVFLTYSRASRGDLGALMGGSLGSPPEMSKRAPGGSEAKNVDFSKKL